MACREGVGVRSAVSALRRRASGPVMPPAFAVPPTPALTLPLPAPSVAIVFLPLSIPLTPAPIALAWALDVSRAFPECYLCSFDAASLHYLDNSAHG